jgi:hypothetical protein
MCGDQKPCRYKSRARVSCTGATNKKQHAHIVFFPPKKKTDKMAASICIERNSLRERRRNIPHLR